VHVTILALNYQPEETGIAPYTSALATSLAGRGHRVTVITTHPHYPEWKIRDGHGGWSRSETSSNVTVRRLHHYVPRSAHGIRRLVSEISFGVRVVLARWGRPEVVVMVSPALFASAMAMGRARWGFRRPAVGLWVQDLYTLGVKEAQSSSNTTAAIIGAIERWTIRKADGVVVIHNRFRLYVTRAQSAISDKVTVIRNWTHLDLDTEVDVPASRARLGWDDDEIVILHAGAQGLKQDLGNVVRAARMADDLSLPVRFVLMGDGSQRGSLEEEAAGVVRIEFIPPLPRAEFQEALKSADILLVNEKKGLNEMAVPSKLTSYFNSGRPVVAATDAGSVTAEEIVASGAGLRVEPGEPSALLEAVLRIGEETGLGDSLATAAHRFREEHLTSNAALLSLEAWVTSLR
jgi:colanic acid biosynthesis glycosyl transferase WcaI